jgi:hypothetical protein
MSNPQLHSLTGETLIEEAHDLNRRCQAYYLTLPESLQTDRFAPNNLAFRTIERVLREAADEELTLRDSEKR